jgi:hypothetical protein
MRASIGPDGQPEHARHLRHQDVHGNAGEKADRHRRRQQIGDAAEAEYAARDQHRAHHQGERDRERLVVRRPGGGEQRQPTGEDRRDGGIRPDREKAVGPPHGKADRARDEGEESDLRREAAEPRGRHLFGNGDRRQRQPGHDVGRHVSAPVGAQ